MVARENAYNQELYQMHELDEVGAEAIAEALETYDDAFLADLLLSVHA